MTENPLVPNESTMKPFVPGDIFLGSTLLNDPNDDHAGRGRILQYDTNLNLKGVLWTEGTKHLVGGLAVDGNGFLWAFDDHVVIHVDPKTGEQLPLHPFPPRVFRSASFANDGSIYIGEHLCGEKKKEGVGTTIEFPIIPDAGILGYGNIYKFNADWELVKEFDVETAPEFTGFKGVTHSTLHPSEDFITYTTETGKRIMRYDVVNDRQMPDLVTYPGEDLRDGICAIAVKYLPDGRLVVTRGTTYDILDEEGSVLEERDLVEFGWTDIVVCGDGEHLLFSNIFTGTMAKVATETGEIVGTIDTEQAKPKRALAGVAEFPG